MPLIGYLAHDLADPAVARRVRMLRLGGAEVALAGLLRGAIPPDLAGAMILGHSADARLARRALTVLQTLAVHLPKLRKRFAGASAIVARNLEMLVVGQAVANGMTPRPRLVYECLDIHRLLIARGPAGGAIRALERRLARSVDLVLTSSPAFITRHLGQVFGERILLVENKVLGQTPRPLRLMPPPFRIGWYGALRCERSFRMLADLSDNMGGRVKVSLRGRPSTAIFPDLPARLADHPHMSFGGPYAASDLSALYGDVHFAWCIDFYEQGANSDWLLPNRLYECAAFGAVPIALAGVETGRFLSRAGVGIALESADPSELCTLFSALSPAHYAALHRAVIDSDPTLWRATDGDCIALVTAISGRAA